LRKEIPSKRGLKKEFMVDPHQTLVLIPKKIEVATIIQKKEKRFKLKNLKEILSY